MMFATYLDCSGEAKQHKVVTVSGFAAPVKKWKRFEEDWGQALDREGIKLFHMTDFACSQGEFKDWKGDKERRGRFLATLVDIIKKDTNRLLTVGVETEAWDRANRMYMLDTKFYSPYALCGYTAVRIALKYAKKKHIRSPIEFIFEDGDEDKKGLKELCRAHKIEPVFQSKEKAVQCQAADLIAWKQRIAMTNALKLEQAIQNASHPDFESFDLMMQEYVSLHKIAPRTGDFWVYGYDRLVQNCTQNRVPERISERTLT